jgi:hypothetical protein
MYSQDELSTLYGFLKSTSEGNLRKMVLGGRMTEAHFKMLMKVVRATTEPEFIQCFDSASYPKIKLTPPEHNLKESLWPICAEAFSRVGLLSSPQEMKKAA